MTKTQYYIDINKPLAFSRFNDYFSMCLDEVLQNRNRPIVILCIGTDRSTGDSLGPLIGYKLSSMRYSNVHVYGTLDKPVHAKNLQENMEEIYNTFTNPVVVAVDACLGNMEHIGYVTVASEGLKPGSGVQKDLPVVGDISIKGIVNFSGYMELLILQNTRLSLVMRMADIIAMGIKYVLWKHCAPTQAQRKEVLPIYPVQ